MQNKKSDKTNLRFFSIELLNDLQNEINSITEALNNGRVTPQVALEALKLAGHDNHLLFWALARQIGHAKGYIRNYATYRKDVVPLNTDQIIDYTIDTDNETDSFRVQVNNNRFGFYADNPSDIRI